MKFFKEILPRAAGVLLVFTIICGVLYTLLITGAAQLLFPNKANGSIITIDGRQYGSELLAQQFQSEKYMWGRIMNIDVSTYKNEKGEPVMYAAPSNLSPSGEKFESLVAQRVEMIRAANPNADTDKVPVDLVTCSGSGLDPHISPAAAYYQAQRIADNNGLELSAVKEMIAKCTNGRLLGFIGEETVNVLKFNILLSQQSSAV